MSWLLAQLIVRWQQDSLNLGSSYIFLRLELHVPTLLRSNSLASLSLCFDSQSKCDKWWMLVGYQKEGEGTREVLQLFCYYCLLLWGCLAVDDVVRKLASKGSHWRNCNYCCFRFLGTVDGTDWDACGTMNQSSICVELPSPTISWCLDPLVWVLGEVGGLLLLL